MVRRLCLVAAVLGLSCLGLAGAANAGGFCPDPSSFTDARTAEVEMTADSCFSPTVTRIEVGGTVTWANKSSQLHAVGGVNNIFGDMHREVRAGKSVSFTFDEEGVFPYVCVFHPGMGGAVVVGDGEGDFTDAAMTNIAAPAAPPSERGSSRETTPSNEGRTEPWLVVAGIALGLGALAIAAVPRRRSGVTVPKPF